MKKLILVLLMIYLNSVFSNEVKIGNLNLNQGTYLSEKCFIKIEKKHDFLVLNFAHTDILLKNSDEDLLRSSNEEDRMVYLTQVYDSQNPFTPDFVPGISIVYDTKNKYVEFGPSRCNKKDTRYLTTVSGTNWWKLRCGNRFEKTNVRFKLRTNKEHDITEFEFIEKYNKDRIFFVYAPWRQNLAYKFICKDLIKSY